jgi:hypothetical protein
MKVSDNMKALLERRDKLRMDVEAAKARLEEVELMIRLIRGEVPLAPREESKGKRASVKQTVIDMVSEAGEAGLSVAECLDAAQTKRGAVLDRGTVSSLLSRFKRDGIVIFDGTRYRMKQHAGPRDAA